MEQFKDWKVHVMDGGLIEATDENGNTIDIFQGHNQRFCLMLNCKVIKSVKTWKPIENKLIEFKGLESL